MSTTPNCPVHNRPMRDWGDAFKCTAKVGETPEGKTRYCSERIAKAPGQEQAAAPAAAPSTAIAPMPEMPSWLSAPLAPYVNNPSYDLLLPSIPVNAELGYGHKVAVSIVRISSDPDNKEVFPLGNGKVGYTKQGIEKMAEAAGISIRTQRVDNRRDRDYCEFRAEAIMKGSSGQPIIRPGTAAFYMPDVQDEAIRKAQAKDRTLSTEQARAACAAEVSMFRKYLVRRTETAAVLAAMRSILGIKSGLTAQQVSVPKVLVRVEFNPDASNPAVANKLLEIGAMSTYALYGAAGAPRHIGADVVDEDEEPEHEPETLAPPDDDSDDRSVALTAGRDYLSLALEGMRVLGIDGREQAELMRQHGNDYKALFEAVNRRAS